MQPKFAIHPHFFHCFCHVNVSHSLLLFLFPLYLPTKDRYRSRNRYPLRWQQACLQCYNYASSSYRTLHPFYSNLTINSIWNLSLTSICSFHCQKLSQAHSTLTISHKPMDSLKGQPSLTIFFTSSPFPRLFKSDATVQCSTSRQAIGSIRQIGALAASGSQGSVHSIADAGDRHLRLTSPLADS